MSKLSFRARALDPSKQMPIYLAEELPDLPEYSAINRAVPQMPSGMEKEEESEHHLQRAICAGLIIPTPEVFTIDQEAYDRMYPPNYKMPRQLIHMQPLGLEQDVPDYDMDSGDEAWINEQSHRLELTPLKFEQMMDRLEKSSGQMVIKLNEAKILLKQDDEISVSVYDYWLNKRLKTQHPLILTVKTENRPGASSNNPYLAFRRRTEKMQTRKNRKNDETSYEKMLKLRRDLQRATTVLEMVKRREKTKREHLHLSIEIFKKRVQLRDFSGAVFNELSSVVKNSRPAFTPLFSNQYSHHSSSAGSTPTGVVPGATIPGVSSVLGPGLLTGGTNNTTSGSGHIYASASQYLNSSSISIDAINTAASVGTRKEKRQYKKRKHKLPRDKQQQQHLQQQQQYLAGVGGTGLPPSGASGSLSTHHLLQLHRCQSSSPAALDSNIETEEDDFGSGGLNGQYSHKLGSESEEEVPFAFRRRQSVTYNKPKELCRGYWPWEVNDQNCGGDPKFRYTLTSLRHPRPRGIGFARRRRGRGGRVMLDRATTIMDPFWREVDFTVFESDSTNTLTHMNPRVKKELTQPDSPPTVVDLPVNVNTVGSATPAATTTQSRKPANINKAETQHAPIPKMAKPELISDDDGAEADFVGYHDDENVQVSKGANRSPYTSSFSVYRKKKGDILRFQQVRQKLRLHSDANMNLNINTDATSIKTNSMSIRKKPMPKEVLRRLSGRLDEKCMENISSYLQAKREMLKGNDASDEVVIDLVRQQKQHPLQRLNNLSNNNFVNYNNNNYNSNSNINKNVNLSDKSHVIKSESVNPVVNDFVEARFSPSVAPKPTSTSTTISSAELNYNALTTNVIKQELIDCASGGASADDSNEPLSSIKKSASATATPTDLPMLDDEEDVNLAQLSNLIRHTVKKEPTEVTDEQGLENNNEEESRRTPLQNLSMVDVDDSITLNQMPDVVRVHQISQQHVKMDNQSESVVSSSGAAEHIVSNMGSWDVEADSTRIGLCKEFLSELQRDWLHYRPKTPTDELLDSSDVMLHDTSPLVDWSQQTPIALEMLTIPENEQKQLLNKRAKHPTEEPLKGLFDDKYYDSLFLPSTFKYVDLEPDIQLLHSVSRPKSRLRSKTPDGGAGGHSISGIDCNLSGDSLTDINLLGDGDETDENMLVNILKECDDIKTLNQATTFWNGLLEGEAEVDEVGADVETAAEILDCIDDKTKSRENRRSSRSKCGNLSGKSLIGIDVVGSSSFNISKTTLTDDVFFQREHEKIETKSKEEVLATVLKTEPVGDLTTAMAKPIDVTVRNTTPQLVPSIITTRPQLAQTIICGGSNTVSQLTRNGAQHLQLATSVTQRQQTIAQLQHQTQHHQQLQSHQQQPSLPEVTASVGDIITVSSNAPILQQQHQQIQQHQLHQAQVQMQPQQHQILQLRQPRLQNVMQQLQQLQQQQQRQQLLLQRDLLSAPVITQYVPANTTAGTTASVSTNTLRQPTLTPIGSTATGNHTIYTTTSADGSVVSAQKIYIQKAGSANSAVTQVPSSLGTNAVITLSNVKLESNEGATSSNATSTIDSNAATASVASTPNVNIISTSGGHQVAVHNIGGVQHSGGGVQHVAAAAATTTSTPLIVTTAATRQSQQIGQQNQQQLLHAQPTQQIVWRQIGGTSNVSAGGGTVTGVLSTTTEAVAASGNKIVWASRPGHKRQLNGPDGAADINKLLLGRKFSRKIIATPSTQQHQIQLTKHLQHLQQQQQQQQQQQHNQQDDDGHNAGQGVHEVSSAMNPGPATTTVAAPASVAQQLQKVQMQGGKVIKMSYPLLVSEVNVQQQQQQHQLQQQKHNSAAIAANHNYSLQPTAILTSQSTTQTGSGNGGSKIYLTSNSPGGVSGGSGNFTITSASDLASAVVQQANSVSSNGSGNVAQKIHHYKELPNTNLKVNFVSAPVSGGNIVHQHGNIVVDAKTVAVQQQQSQQQSQQQTVVLNKAATAMSNIQQQKLKREGILNIIGASKVDTTNVLNSSGSGGAMLDSSKRVLYTSLLNVKPLQKNTAGQMQMQIGTTSIPHALLRGRIGNNQTIFTNMRTVPIATTANNAVQQLQISNTSVSGGNGSSTMAVNTNMSQVTTNSSALGTSAQQHTIAVTGTVADTSGVTTNSVTTLGNNTISSNDLKVMDNVDMINSVTMSSGTVNSGGGGVTNNNSSSSNNGGGGMNTTASTTVTTANANNVSSAINR